MFGLSFDKLLIIGVLAVIVLGPKKLPYYASQLAKGVKWARAAILSAQDRVKDEMGDDYNDVDWKKLDPRQYDPRRIIREALLDDPMSTPGADAEWHAASAVATPEEDRAATARPATALSVPPQQARRTAARTLPADADTAGSADLAS